MNDGPLKKKKKKKKRGDRIDNSEKLLGKIRFPLLSALVFSLKKKIHLPIHCNALFYHHHPALTASSKPSLASSRSSTPTPEPTPLPKWQDILGQFSMVNMELFKIMEDIQKVSKAFVVYPRNVNAESATILPVMLSSKLLPEMEVEDNAKRELLLHGLTNLPMRRIKDTCRAKAAPIISS